MSTRYIAYKFKYGKECFDSIYEWIQLYLCKNNTSIVLDYLTACIYDTVSFKMNDLTIKAWFNNGCPEPYELPYSVFQVTFLDETKVFRYTEDMYIRDEDGEETEIDNYKLLVNDLAPYIYHPRTNQDDGVLAHFLINQFILNCERLAFTLEEPPVLLLRNRGDKTQLPEDLMYDVFDMEEEVNEGKDIYSLSYLRRWEGLTEEKVLKCFADCYRGDMFRKEYYRNTGANYVTGLFHRHFYMSWPHLTEQFQEILSKQCRMFIHEGDRWFYALKTNNFEVFRDKVTLK